MRKIHLILGLVVLALILFLFLNFRVPSIVQSIYYEDFNVQKEVTVKSVLTESYLINQANPSVCLIIIPQGFTEPIIEGDFILNTLSERIFLAVPQKASPGNKNMKIYFNEFNPSLTTIAFFIPLADYLKFSLDEKKDLLDSAKKISSLDSNYFSLSESLKIMQEFADSVFKKKILTKSEEKKDKIFFSDDKNESVFNTINYSGVINYIASTRQNYAKNVSKDLTNEKNILNNSLNYVDAIEKIVLKRTNKADAINSESTDYNIIINFKPEPKIFPSKIIIPFSKENPLVIWNGEFEPGETELRELFFEPEDNRGEILFEYALVDKIEEENLKYLISFTVDTGKISSSFTTIKGVILEKGFIPKKYPVEITLIENPCEKRINQFTEFESDYNAEYIKQFELYKASECILGITTALLDLTSKPDQNWIGRNEQLSSKILKEFDLNEEGRKNFINEQKERREKYFTDFFQGQKNIDTNISPVLLQSKNSINLIENYLSKIDDANALKSLKLKLIYAKIGVDELKLIIDPTDYEAFKRKTENEINFILDINSNTNTSDLNSLRSMIYANNYIKHGAWDSESVYLEMGNAKYSLEQDLYSSMKALATKMYPSFKSMNWFCLDPLVYADAFDPYSKNFNNKLNKSFREAIFYIGLSKELILEQESVEKLGKHVDAYCGSMRSPLIKFSYKFDSSYDFERNRVVELFKEYMGLKLVMDLAYDVNKVQTEIKEQGYVDKADINYYPKSLEFSSVDKNKTFQEIYLADINTLGKWIKGINYDSKKDYASMQIAREYIQSVYFNSLNYKLRTIEHYKFRPTIENISDAQGLAVQLALFDNIAQNEYQKIIELKEKEGKLGNWNYFLVNLFTDPAKLRETQNEIKFRLTALNGIRQIQMLLIDGKNIAQIHQQNDNWQQKTLFDSDSENKIAADLYSTAKKDGYERALALKKSEIIPIEGIIDGRKVSDVSVAMLLPPVRVELKKVYVSESNKIENKTALENAENMEEVEKIILPESYKAELLLENADYYYSESLYSVAYQTYGDIVAFYKSTPSAEKASLQMKKFSAWRMVFSKPYWETFSKFGKEFLTVKGIASYLAFGFVLKYAVVPSFVQSAAVNQVQKAYALKSTIVSSKTLMTPLQARTTNIILKLKDAGKVIARNAKRFKDATWKVMTYDITGGDAAYKAWIQRLAREAALNEQAIIQTQLSALKKLSATPFDEMNSIQLSEAKEILGRLKQSNLLNENEFNTVLNIVDNQINFVKAEESLRAASTGSGTVIDITPIDVTPIDSTVSAYNTTQLVPVSHAKTALSLFGASDVITYPTISSLRAAQVASEARALNAIDEMKLAYAEERVNFLTEKLGAARKSKGYVSYNYLKSCEEDLIEAQEEINFLKNSFANSSNSIKGLTQEDFDALSQFSFEKITFEVPLETYNTYEHAMEIVVAMNGSNVTVTNTNFPSTSQAYLSPQQAYSSIQSDPYLKYYADTGQARFLGVNDFSKECGYPVVATTGLSAEVIPGMCLSQNQIVLVNLQHFKFTEVSGIERVARITGVMEHELDHRGFYWVSENERQYIMSRFISNPKWDQIKEEFLTYFPSYKNKRQISLITEMISKAIQNEYLPNWYDYSPGASDFLAKEISPIVDTTTRQLIAKGRKNWLINYQNHVQQVSKTRTGSFWKRLTKIFNPTATEFEIVAKTQGYDIVGKNKVLLKECVNGCTYKLNGTQINADSILAEQGKIAEGTAVDMKRVSGIIISSQNNSSLINRLGNDLGATPTNTVIFNKALGKRWVESFTDSMEMQIAQNLLDNIKVRSIQEFEQATKESAQRISSAVGDELFAVLFDFDAGKSKRWIFENYHESLQKQPSYANYFSKNHHDKILSELFDSGINTFVIWDDASYSGSDAITRFIEVINKRYVGKLVKPKIIVAYSYYTDTAKSAITANENVIFIGIERMQTVEDVLTLEQKSFLASKEALLSDGTEVLTGLSTETMPYKIPDDHSFVAEKKLVERGIISGQPPYKNSTNKYTQLEAEEFNNYFLKGPTNLVTSNAKSLSFTCSSPCVWNDGSAIKFIESSSDIQIKGDFSQMGEVKIVEYSPELVASEGIEQALKRVPNLEPYLITQIESAMKEGKTIATIQSGITSQEIVVYTRDIKTSKGYRDIITTKNLSEIPLGFPNAVTPKENVINSLDGVDKLLKDSPEKIKVLCISQQDYVDPELKLRFTDNDAMTIEKYFLEQGVPQQNVTRISSPNKKEFLEILSKITKTIKQDETLVVYYAGHTYNEEFIAGGKISRNFYFAPKDFVIEDLSGNVGSSENLTRDIKIVKTEINRDIQTIKKIDSDRDIIVTKELPYSSNIVIKNFISTEEVSELLKTNSGEIIFISDSCHSGSTCEVLAKQFDKGIFIGSTRVGELAIESPILERGVWTALFEEPSNINKLIFNQIPIDPTTIKSFGARVLFASENVGLATGYKTQTAGTIITK